MRGPLYAQVMMVDGQSRIFLRRDCEDGRWRFDARSSDGSRVRFFSWVYLLAVGCFFFVNTRAWERSGPLREEGDGQSSE